MGFNFIVPDSIQFVELKKYSTKLVQFKNKQI